MRHALVPVPISVMPVTVRLTLRGASGRVGPQGRSPPRRATGRGGAQRRRLDLRKAQLGSSASLDADSPAFTQQGVQPSRGSKLQQI